MVKSNLPVADEVSRLSFSEIRRIPFSLNSSISSERFLTLLPSRLRLSITTLSPCSRRDSMRSSSGRLFFAPEIFLMFPPFTSFLHSFPSSISHWTVVSLRRIGLLSNSSGFLKEFNSASLTHHLFNKLLLNSSHGNAVSVFQLSFSISALNSFLLN